MSWKDRLQQGSFRGVPFYTEKTTGTGGRRAIVHEYPAQEFHTTQDLGKNSGKEQKLTVFVIGQDYDLALKNLRKALDQPEPGILKHGTHGSQLVQIAQIGWTISSRKGGFAKVEISYYFASARRVMPRIANGQRLAAAAATAQALSHQDFANNFSVDKQPAHVVEQAQNQLQNAVDSLRSINGRISAASRPLIDTAELIDELGSQLSTLIKTPIVLIEKLTAVIASVIGAKNDIAGAFKLYENIAQTASINHLIKRTTSNGTTTPSRERMANNQQSISTALSNSATLAMANVIASKNSIFDSFDQAINTRDAVLSALDNIADDEQLSYEHYTAIVDVQTNLTQHIDDIAPGLAKINYVQLEQSLPALVLAYQQTGDANNADQLVKRNALAHPGFVPAGSSIEVLT